MRCLRNPSETYPNGLWDVPKQCRACVGRSAPGYDHRPAMARQEQQAARRKGKRHRRHTAASARPGTVLTALHKRIRAILCLGDLGFLSEQCIGPYRVDEFHRDKRVIVEINGDYVHANPKKYPYDTPISVNGLRYTARQKWEQDLHRANYLRKQGYLVLTVWESDDMENWKERIKMALLR